MKFCVHIVCNETSQSKFRNHYFLFLFAFSILSQLFLIWGRILHKTNKKKFLVNCWPSGKYVNLLYMYSILGRAPFALITASIRRGMEVISLWHC